ncbi:hypothetical protein [Leifsonia sp. SIMBA_070]|uniref:hypothetical protein n=1 Tax=Leifsonia sp. SIMBA_070 TaxID=3085810 RepID=UPI00397C9F04
MPTAYMLNPSDGATIQTTRNAAVPSTSAVLLRPAPGRVVALVVPFTLTEPTPAG